MLLLSLKVCFVVEKIHQTLLQISYCIILILPYIDIIIVLYSMFIFLHENVVKIKLATRLI